MSKLPLPNNRSNHGSPPVKNRKALSNITEVINSPKFSKNNTINTEPQRPTLKMDTRKQRVPKTSIPTSHISSETMLKVRGLSLAGSELQSRKPEKSNRKSNIFDSTSFKDPAAIKKQEELEQRFEKYVDVQREKLEELNRQINESKRKMEELTKSKNSFARNTFDLKSKIDEAEVNIIHMEDKIQTLQKNVEKTIAHEEQMNTVKLKEQQNLMIRELDEFKGMLNQELQNAQAYKDDEAVKEIAKLEEESNHVSLTLNSLKQATKERLDKEREHLEKELEKIVTKEESKGDELAKKFEEKSNFIDGLKIKVKELESKIMGVDNEKKEFDNEMQQHLKLQSTYNDEFNELEKQVQELELKDSNIDQELSNINHEHESVTALYNESHHKIDKERKLRRRIQNSIQELTNKLRVYTRILDHETSNKLSFNINQQDEDGKQNLILDDKKYYTFDKVFTEEFKDQEVCDEIVCLSENNLNGANVSIIMTGFEDNTLIQELLKTTFNNLIQREDKYKSKQWVFKYTIQYLSITTEGVVDLLTGTQSNVKLENRSVQTDAKSIESLSDISHIEPPSDASTLIKLIVSGTNPQKSFIASTYLINLSQIKSTDLILHAVTKIKDNKFSTSEFAESPMYQLIHCLYANTKTLTLVNLSNNVENLKENEKLLEIANFINQVDAVPTKRVYSSPIFK